MCVHPACSHVCAACAQQEVSCPITPSAAASILPRPRTWRAGKRRQSTWAGGKAARRPHVLLYVLLGLHVVATLVHAFARRCTRRWPTGARTYAVMSKGRAAAAAPWSAAHGWSTPCAGRMLPAARAWRRPPAAISRPLRCSRVGSLGSGSSHAAAQRARTCIARGPAAGAADRRPASSDGASAQPSRRGTRTGAWHQPQRTPEHPAHPPRGLGSQPSGRALRLQGAPAQGDQASPAASPRYIRARQGHSAASSLQTTHPRLLYSASHRVHSTTAHAHTHAHARSSAQGTPAAQHGVPPAPAGAVPPGSR